MTDQQNQIDNKSEKKPFYKRILDWPKGPAPKRKWPRFAHTLLNRILKDDVAYVASVLAYHILMAVIPLMLVLIQGTSYFVPNPESLLMTYIRDMPQWVAEIVGNIVTTIASGLSTATITVGVIAALWSGSRGIEILMKTINDSFGLVDTRNIIFRKIIAVAYTVLLMVFIITSLLFSVFSDRIIQIIRQLLIVDFPLIDWLIDSGVLLLLRVLPYLVLVVLLTFFYRMAPSSKSNVRITIPEAFIGAILATTAIFLLTWIYAFIVENISNLSLYYGSLAGILSLLIWLLWICQIIVIGAEIVASYCEVFRGKFFGRRTETSQALQEDTETNQEPNEGTEETRQELQEGAETHQEPNDGAQIGDLVTPFEKTPSLDDTQRIEGLKQKGDRNE